MHAAFDGGEIVGGAGAFPFELTVPGGALPCAGVTVVGVLPIASAPRRAAPDDGRAAARRPRARRADRRAVGLGGDDLRPLRLRARLALAQRRRRASRRRDPQRACPRERLDAAGRRRRGAPAFPRLYERVGRARPGFLVRSRDWWAIRQLDDRPETRRGGGPLVCALLERDGRPVGYALYRLVQEGSTPETGRRRARRRGVGVDDAATREIWRFLLADRLDRPRRGVPPAASTTRCCCSSTASTSCTLSVWDGLWVRGVDVAGGARRAGVRGRRPRHARGRLRPALPGQRRHVDDRRRRGAPRAPRAPDVRLAVEALGSAFLGGFSFAELARAGRAEEARAAASPGRRGVPGVGGALVPRDLLSRRDRSERPRGRAAWPANWPAAASRCGR